VSDIFISYSRKDSEQALQLAELLQSAGLSCWIDQRGIELATSWSKEIVAAINGCQVFVVLLSASSVESHNVVKEVSLASEKRKKILPLELDACSLPEELQYQLAGIQRSPMTNIDSIIRALGKLGLEATGSPRSPKITREDDDRMSLMILPFEDLSPTGDNGWFADGLASELISALSNVKALRVSDPQSTKEFKRYQGTLPRYAQEMSIRYFLQGDVRKFGDQIKITTRLLDIETGDFLWQDAMKGIMDDIFDIQERVAEKVVEGLRVHLDSGEKAKLAERGTGNAEAYELYLRAKEYSLRNTKEGCRLANQVLREAIKLDPSFAEAYQLNAHVLTVLYRGYDQSPALLDEAEALCKEALRRKPELTTSYQPLLLVHLYRGQVERSEELAREYVKRAPDKAESHFALGFFFTETGQHAEATTHYEAAVRLKPDGVLALWNLVLSCRKAGDQEKCERWAATALPLFERRIKLHPDAEGNHVSHALLMYYAGRRDAAIETARTLVDLKDGVSLYNIACLFGMLGQPEEALVAFRKAIEAGFTNVSAVKSFIDAEDDGIQSLKGTPEYEELQRKVDDLVAKLQSLEST
jgi:adenylate cyclase